MWPWAGNLNRGCTDGLTRFPEKLRQPLALAALGELKLVEIAEILGLPEGTVRRRIHTARARLRQELMERKGDNHERRS
jgi:RNA polymerase sigma-70 factor (ECF subfamily)